MIDFLTETENEVIIIDYKTDKSKPEYFEQLRLYIEILKTGPRAQKTFRAGLLLTERGTFEWLKKK